MLLCVNLIILYTIPACMFLFSGQIYDILSKDYLRFNYHEKAGVCFCLICDIIRVVLSHCFEVLTIRNLVQRIFIPSSDLPSSFTNIVNPLPSMNRYQVSNMPTRKRKQSSSSSSSSSSDSSDSSDASPPRRTFFLTYYFTAFSLPFFFNVLTRL